MKKNYLTQNVFSASVMLLFGALFLIGTFNDKTIAETLYSPDDLPVRFSFSCSELCSREHSIRTRASLQKRQSALSVSSQQQS